MDAEAIRIRVREVRKRLTEAGADCLIVTKGANVRYLTGFAGEDSWCVVTGHGVYLVTDSRYSEQAEAECCRCRIVERKEPMAAAVAKLLGRQRSVNKIGVETSVSLEVYGKLKKNIRRGLKPVSGIVEQLRSVKDEQEVAAIKGAIRIADKALKVVRRRVERGLSEIAVAGRLEAAIRNLGGQTAFETIVAFGSNASRPHHRPGGRRLRKNDTVLIDFGVRHKGYCCDLTRCFAYGKVSGLYERAYEAVKEAQKAARQAVRPGAKATEIDRAAREVIQRYDLPVYGHGTGHGLGLEVHELPVLSGRSEAQLLVGQVVTIEPAVYIAGVLGVRIEDDVLVAGTGRRVLSGRCHLA